MKKKTAGLPKEKYITPKKADLERRFNEYNEMYFDGVLPPCWMIVKETPYIPAMYEGSLKKGRIYIATNVYWTDEKLKLVLIHEMAHCYVDKILGYHSFFSHGRTYRKVCRMLRKKHGLRVNLWELPYRHVKGKKKPSLLTEITVRFLSWILPL